MWKEVGLIPAAFATGGNARVRGVGGAPCQSRHTWRDCSLCSTYSGSEERTEREATTEGDLCSDCSPCLALLIASALGLSVTCVDYKGRGEEFGTRLNLVMGEERRFAECISVCFFGFVSQ